MSTQNAQVIWYGGVNSVAGIPSRNDIISECDNRLTAMLQQSLSDKWPIYFIPNDVSDATEYVKNVSTYILRIHSILINRQKARVDITGIKSFFDVVIPDGESLAIFKSNLVKIVSKTLKSISKFEIKIDYGFPVHGYHTEKKPHIRITTWNQYDGYNALKVVCESDMKTASDDLNGKYYYRKITHEKRLPLSSWTTLYDYIYNKNTFRVFVDDYKPIDKNKYKNSLIAPALF